jgi:hypothetical protein
VTQQQPWRPSSESKTASNTVVVLLIVIGAPIVLALLCCVGFLVLGGLGGAYTG